MTAFTHARLATATLALLLTLTTVHAAEFSPSLNEYLKSAPSSELISAVLYLEGPVDIRRLDLQLHEQRATPQERHVRVIEALKFNAASAQPDLLTDLDRAQLDGSVKGYKAYWIDNLIVVYGTKEFLETFRERGDVQWVSENFHAELIAPVGNPSGQGTRPPRGALDEFTTSGQDAIGATRVNRELGYTGQGVLVANLDTGVDGNHPALAARWRGNFAPSSECWLDVLSFTPTTFPSDNNSHGTHVMGTITGREIEEGGDTTTIGGAPNALWIACNAINQGVGQDLDNDVLDAYEWFIDPDGDPETMDDVPDVVQNSWGVAGFFPGYSDCFELWNEFIQNVEAAGTVVTWSAGNEGPSAASMRAPANFSMSAVQMFSVGACEVLSADPPNYTIADFSSRGPSDCTPAEPDNIKPEISAPGVDIFSSVPGGNYESAGWSGTSMAGPHVAGVVALMREACPACDPITIKEALLATAVDQGPAGEDNTWGMGVIDAYEAVLAVANLGRIMGTITDGSQPLEGVQIEILDTDRSDVSGVDGSYEIGLSSGMYGLRATLFGYGEVTMPNVEVLEAETTLVNIVMNQLPLVTLSGFVLRPDQSPVANAEISVLNYPVESVMSQANGFYSITMPRGLIYLLQASTETEGFVQHLQELTGNLTHNFVLPTLLFCYDFETDQGWTVGAPADSVTRGEWERVNPDPTFNNGRPVQPGDDHTSDPGAICWVTEGAAGGIAGEGDVDNGITWLLSPVWDFSEEDFVVIELWMWYSNDEGNNPSEDPIEIDVSNDGGTTWTNLLSTMDNWEEWRKVRVGVGHSGTLTNAMQIRIAAIDLGSGSLVEAAVDDVCLYSTNSSLTAPQNLTIRRDGGNIILDWSAVPNAGSYEVWKQNYLPITTASATIIGYPEEPTFVDTNAPSGQTGFYFVTARP